jgi:hypothetical protein
MHPLYLSSLQTGDPKRYAAHSARDGAWEAGKVVEGERVDGTGEEIDDE